LITPVTATRDRDRMPKVAKASTIVPVECHCRWGYHTKAFPMTRLKASKQSTYIGWLRATLRNHSQNSDFFTVRSKTLDDSVLEST
jgi:hypothetical protein